MRDYILAKLFPELEAASCIRINRNHIATHHVVVVVVVLLLLLLLLLKLN